MSGGRGLRPASFHRLARPALGFDGVELSRSCTMHLQNISGTRVIDLVTRPRPSFRSLGCRTHSTRPEGARPPCLLLRRRLAELRAVKDDATYPAECSKFSRRDEQRLCSTDLSLASGRRRDRPFACDATGAPAQRQAVRGVVWLDVPRLPVPPPPGRAASRLSRRGPVRTSRVRCCRRSLPECQADARRGRG